MVTYTRPEWVKPGQQWSAGQTLEEYKTAGGIVNGEFKINEQEVKQLDTTNANGFLEKQRAESLAEEERAKKRKEEEEARYKAEKKTLWDKLLGKQTVEEKQKAEYEELGYEPAEYIKERKADIADLEGMWTSYNKKESERDAAIARQEGRPGADIAFQNREVQNITNKYNIEINRIAAKINTKSAIMAQKQGLMNEAKAFVKEAVDAYTYDLQLAYTQFDKFEEDNRDLLEEIGQEYKDALAETKEINYKIYEEAKTEKTNVMNLMLDTPAAGITIDDTLEEAIRKASEWQAAQPEAVPTYAPTQYNKEWTEAGGLAGTGMSLSDWIKQRTGIEVGGIDTRKYIQDPTNPTASIPNPNYGKPITPEIPPPPDYVASFQAYRDASWSRDQVESSWISQYNSTVSAANQLRDKKEMERNFPEIKSALDEVYGKEPGIFQKIGDWWSGLWG